MFQIKTFTFSTAKNASFILQILFILNTLAFRLLDLNIKIYEIFSFNTLIFAEYPSVLNVALIIDFMFGKMNMYRCLKKQNFAED